MPRYRLVSTLACSLFLMAGCTRENALPEGPEPAPPAYSSPDLPDAPFGYAEMDFPESWLNDPALALFGGFGSDVDITNEGATLGRVLFHDTRLSADNSVSCGTCHKPAHAFAEPEAGSTGISGSPLHRNTPGLFNLRYQRRLFWDLRTVGLQNQVLQPVGHPDEMGMDLGVADRKAGCHLLLPPFV